MTLRIVNCSECAQGNHAIPIRMTDHTPREGEGG